MKRSIERHGFATHHSRALEYYTWQKMIQRCFNPNNSYYHRYGGRGITVCDRWRHSFKAFIKDIGLRPTPKTSIERINNDGNYEPGNCRWATPREQSNNTVRTQFVNIDGGLVPLSYAADKLGVNRDAAYYTFVTKPKRKKPQEFNP